MVERTSTELSQSGSFGLLTDSGDGEPTLSVVIERNKLPDSPQLSVFNPLHWKPLITSYLASNHPAIATVYTIIAAFSAYFSIYGISSSLFVATFDGVKVFGGLDLKVAFSISQMLGYAVSKVAGAIIIPTIKRHQRCPTLILLAVLAEAPLVIFGFTPAISQVIMVFLSGIPMAWMWGIMVMYLEGRKTSEFLLMGLYLSVMVASGAAKSIAAAVLKAGIAESWMPALCGAFSALAFILFILMLDAVPDPNVEDKKVRSERRTMSQAEARRFLVRWAPGLILVTLVYALLGAYRNFRDYFSPELWRDLEGPDFDPSRFTQSELPVGICTAVAYSTLYFIKDNKKAFFGILGVMFTGGAVILIATFAQTFDWVNPLEWMIMVGVGLFMAFIPPGAMLYDRFNGATGHPYTSVFMIYLSDVCGYCFTLAVLFYRNFGDANISYVKFFHSLSFIVSIVCMGGMTAAGVYFYFAMRNLQPLAPSHSGEEVGQVQKGGVVPTEEVELEETKKPVEEEIYVEEEKKHEDDEEHEKPKEEEESEEVLAQSPLI